MDESLTAQIHLNLASSYYKLGDHVKAFSSLELSSYSKLSEGEAGKFHHLQYLLSVELDRRDLALKALTRYLGSKETLMELKEETLFENLKNEQYTM